MHLHHRVISQRRALWLLIVGAADPVVVDLDREAVATLRVQTRLEVIAGAGHLFLARDWFLRHMPVAPMPRRATG